MRTTKETTTVFIGFIGQVEYPKALTGEQESSDPKQGACIIVILVLVVYRHLWQLTKYWKNSSLLTPYGG